MDKQEWFELEYSAAGTDDWFASSGDTADTEAGIRALLAAKRKAFEVDLLLGRFEFRAVRKVLTTEVLNG